MANYSLRTLFLLQILLKFFLHQEEKLSIMISPLILLNIQSRIR